MLATARIAGIMAAKRTHELIPLCHPLLVTGSPSISSPTQLPGLRVEASVKVHGQTGVEMEALTAVSVACLTIYDMVKAVDRAMRIEGIRLLEKAGGKSGPWKAEDRPMSLLSVEEALRARCFRCRARWLRTMPLCEGARPCPARRRQRHFARSRPSTPPPWMATPLRGGGFDARAPS